MALLTAEKDKIAAAIQRTWSDTHEDCPFAKTDLRAAVDAVDTWIEGNQASFNTALPVAFRTTATAAQKTLLFCYVALKRAGLATPRES